jgi:hypothetical protein
MAMRAIDLDEARRVQAHRQAENPAERLDRNFNELLGELRIALPGIQVLFAFLLTVPFAQRFASIQTFDRVVYIVALLSTAVAAVLLIAPTAYHRHSFRCGRKHEIVRFANTAILAGLGVLALAMTAAILLVTHVIFGAVTAAAVTLGSAAMFVTLWYVVPVHHRDRD